MSRKEHGLAYTIVFTFTICFVFVFGLVFANEQIDAMVQRNKQIAAQSAVLNAFGIVYTNQEDVQALYADILKEKYDGIELFKSTKDDQTRYAKHFVGAGLWGSIEGIIAVSEDMQRIVGLEIISHNETPGLGGRIEEDWFTDQFRNELIVDGTITVMGQGQGDPDSENGNVDAITGASRTSASMQSMLNNELAIMANLLGD